MDDTGAQVHSGQIFKTKVLEFVLFGFKMDDIGKFTMDKWWLPRFSSLRRDPSFPVRK